MSEHKFKVGDRVRVITKSGNDPLIGKLGTILESNDRDIYVLASIDGVEASKVWFARCNLELAEPAPIASECLTVDNVNHPPHYNQGGIECIDAIKAATGSGFIKYCTGNVIKYLWRYDNKGGLEDLKKAAWYLDRAIKEMEVTSE
jgi:hypothetical protein